MPEDLWIHRSENMRCKTCMFFVPKIPAGPGQVVAVKGDRPITASEFFKAPPFDLGRCRRHAPTLSGWPAVFVNDFCGDHKLDENKWEAQSCPNSK